VSIYKPAGPAIQNIDFRFMNSNGGALTAGQLFLTTIDLPLGFPVSTIYWFPGTTALVLGTSPHYWVALFDSATRALLRQSTDDTAAVISASTLKSTALSSTYTTTTAGQFLGGIMVAQTGGTMPTFANFSSVSAVTGVVSVGGQKFNGNSASTSLGATAPNPAGAITSTANIPWIGVA
jgi:hypothetical protein